MRMAMSCFAWPVRGLPTRRARFNSASVDSGMSEKSMQLSDICLPLLAAHLPGADDAYSFCVISQPPQGINNQENATPQGPSESLPAALRLPMLPIFPVQAIGVAENSRGILE